MAKFQLPVLKSLRVEYFSPFISKVTLAVAGNAISCSEIQAFSSFPLVKIGGNVRKKPGVLFLLKLILEYLNFQIKWYEPSFISFCDENSHSEQSYFKLHASWGHNTQMSYEWFLLQQQPINYKNKIYLFKIIYLCLALVKNLITACNGTICSVLMDNERVFILFIAKVIGEMEVIILILFFGSTATGICKTV